VTGLLRWATRAIVAGAAGASVVLGASLAWAQQGDKGYVPLQPGQSPQELLPATPLVFWAYAFVWIALVVYIFALSRRLSKLERELVDLRSKSPAPRA
jgi:CcmD family protein